MKMMFSKIIDEAPKPGLVKIQKSNLLNLIFWYENTT